MLARIALFESEAMCARMRPWRIDDGSFTEETSLLGCVSPAGPDKGMTMKRIGSIVLLSVLASLPA